MSIDVLGSGGPPLICILTRTVSFLVHRVLGQLGLNAENLTLHSVRVSGLLTNYLEKLVLVNLAVSSNSTL